MEDYVENVASFETAGAVASTVGASVSVLGTGLLATPAAPLGVTYLGIAAAHSAYNTAVKTAKHKHYNVHLQI